MANLTYSAHPRDIENILVKQLATLLGPTIRLDANATFAGLGLESHQLATLAREIGETLGRPVSPTAFFEHPSIAKLAEHLAGVNASTSGTHARADIERDEPIAIVGMSCRFAHVDGLDAFWRVLSTGEDCVSEIPPTRWDAAALHDPTGRNPKSSITRHAGLIDAVDLFEPEFFGLSPREASSVDPQQRLMLELTWEALEHAGLPPTGLRGRRVGVFVGGMTTDYGELTWATSNSINANYGTGSALTLLSNRISYLFGFCGPSLTVDTACASSLTALHLACQSLRRGEADLALAGGVILHLRPNGFATMSRLGALAPDGRSKAFSADANGYGRGEGGGLVCLKRLADARRDGDEIHCIVRGTAINHNGQSNGLTAPSPHAQAALLREAWARADADPAEAAYVEAHGTGTALGDPLEAEALGRVLGAVRAADDPLFIGSVKSNIGHTEAAAGAAGLIKVALAMRHRSIPPTLHAEVTNPLIRFDEWRLRVPTSATPWPDGRRLAGVSAFGFGGANAHAVLESAMPARFHVLAREVADDVSRGLDAKTTRIVDGPARIAVVAQSRREAESALVAAQAADNPAGVVRGRAQTQGRTAFVFGGIGSVWGGMGRHPITQRHAFREIVERCDPITRRRMGVSIAWELHRGPTADRLEDPLLHGLFAVVMGMALDAVWRDLGVTPDAVVGHSIGEFAAAVGAGALTPEEATEVVCEFLRWNRRLVEADTAMAAVGLDADAACEALAGFEDHLGVCVDNAPDQVVIGGQATALAEVCARIGARGVDVRPIRARLAPHSPVARRLADGLSAALGNNIIARPLRVPWISTVTAAPLDAAAVDGGYWARNLGEPNRFREAIVELARQGCDAFVMVAAHPVLRGAIASTLASVSASARVLTTLVRESADERDLYETTATLWTLGRAGDPDAARPTVDATPCDRPLVLPISAAVPASLDALVTDWRGRLASLDPSALALACGAAGARRSHHRHRIAVVGRDAGSLAEKLATARATATPASPAPVVFVFSGQGASFEGVGRALYAEEPAFREPFDACDRAVRSLAGWSIVDALLDVNADARAKRTSLVQPLIFAIQIGLAGLWRSFGITPAAIVGQSVGEIAAACVAGALTIEEATRVVLHRGRLMEQAAAGGRTAEIALSAADVERFLQGRGGVCIAGINGPSTTLVAGDAGVVADVVNALEAEGASCRMLRMEYAFHSHHMDALLPRLAEALGEVRSTAPKIELWSTVTGSAVDAPLDASYWCANVRAPVRLATVIEKLLATGHTTLLEVSPHPVLGEPLRACVSARAPNGVVLRSLRRNRDDREELLDALGSLYALGHDIAWDAVQGRGDPTLAPRYRWDRRRFWFEATEIATAAVGPGLLGRRLDSGAHPGTVYWEAVVSADAPGWLGDHRVRGRAIVPGAAFAEMALAAGGIVVGGALEVRELRFLRALDIGEPRLLQVCLEREGEGARVRVLSRAVAHADALQVLHATARLVPALGAADEEALREMREARCDSVVDVRALYERLASAGLEYGPLFRGVTTLHEREGRATGDVLLPESLSASSSALHPALLDACFHVAAAALPADGEMWLPVGIDRLRVHEPGARSLRVHASTEILGESRVARLRAFSDDGRLALEVDGLRVTRVNASRALPPLEDWLHEERWVPSPLPTIENAPLEGTWIVLSASSDDATGKALARAIEGCGAEVLVATPTTRLDGALARDVRGVIATTTLDVPRSALDAAVLDVVDAAVFAVRAATAASAPLYMLTRGARGIDDAAAEAPACAAAWGVARTLSMEDPARYGGIIDLDPKGPIEEQLPRVVAELAAGLPDDQVVYRGGERRAGRLAQSRELGGAPIICRSDATYIITGGLGGLGLIAANWLADRGARRLVLLSRTGLPSRSKWSAPDTSSSSARVSAVRALEARGVTLRVELVDVGDRIALTRTLARLAEEMPPIRGVVHAAGVLHDQAMTNVDRESASAVLAPKVGGALTLDEALGASLDFFVLYSSAAGTIGSAGQAAYAAANVVLDEIARARRARGLAATSVAWGAWAEVGMAADARLLERLAAAGIGAIPPAAGAQLLDWLASANAPHVGVFPIHWSMFRAARAAVAKRGWLSALGHERETDPHAVADQAPSPLLDLSDPTSRTSNIASWLESCAARLLGIPLSRMRRDMSLQSLGLDSLVAVELRNAIETALGTKVQLAALSDSSVQSLAERIAARFAPVSLVPAEQRDAPASSRWVPLVKLSEGVSRPLVCVHPVGGNVLCYRPLAAQLGRNQPVWALQAPTGGEAPPDRTIETMAERYLDAARAAGAGKPWLFCGFSFGGAVVYEMALRAVQRGEHVACVVLIDARVQRQSLLPDEETLLEWCLKDLTGGHNAALAEGATPAARVLGGARRAGLFGPEITEAAMAPLIDVFRASVGAMVAWQPAPARFPVTLLRGADTLPEHVEPWRRACGGALEEIPLTGDHYSLLRAPHVSTIAAHVEACIRRNPSANAVLEGQT